MSQLKITEFEIGHELAELMISSSSSVAADVEINQQCNNLLLPELKLDDATIMSDFKNRNQVFENCLPYRRWVHVPTDAGSVEFPKDFRHLVPESDYIYVNGYLFLKWSGSYPNSVPVPGNSMFKQQNLCEFDNHCTFLMDSDALATFGHEKLGCSSKAAADELPFSDAKYQPGDAKCDSDKKICTASFADGGIVCNYGYALNAQNPELLEFPPINGADANGNPNPVSVSDFALYCFEGQLKAFAECTGASVAFDFVFGPEAEAVSVPTCAGLNLMNFNSACFGPLVALNGLTGQGCTTNLWKVTEWALKNVD